MKKSHLLFFLIGLALTPLAHAQNIFTGEGDWLEEALWSEGLPGDGSTAIVNGTAVISEDIVEINQANPSRVEIGTGAEGTLTVSGGTLSGAHGGSQGIFVGVGAGGKGTLIIEEGAAFRSQGGGMNVRIGDNEGGEGTIIVAGELLNFKFFELLNGTLEMRPTGINAKFNQLDTRSPIGPNGVLSFIIDGSQIGSLKRSNTSGLNVDIDPGATLKITLNGDFQVGDSWQLMDYTSITGQFAQGTAFANEQGFGFEIDYGSGNNDEMRLTLVSTDARPQIDSFTSTPPAIGAGETAVLEWNSPKFTTLAIDNGIGDVSANGNGTVEVQPTETTTYTLTAIFNGVETAESVTVVVDDRPIVDFITASPDLIAPSGETELKWRVSGANSVSIDSGIGDVDAQGQMIVQPNETTRYKITAENGFGSVSQEVTVTVNALEAALINLYEAFAPGQSEGAFLDSVGKANFDMKTSELAVVESERTTITTAHRMVEFVTNSGGDNGNGYPGGDTTYEVWVKIGDFIEDVEHQVIFETGGGGNGTSIRATPQAIRLIHSQSGTRTIDVEVSLLQINAEEDYLQIVAAMDDTNSSATLFVRGAAGGMGSATAQGTIGVPIGRASVFVYSNFGGGIDGALGGSAGSPPENVALFAGEFAALKVYDRTLTETEIEQAFKKLAVEGDDDADNDGLLDFWEVRFFGNTNARANADPDGDGLTNIGEFETGALPDNPDTDGDGLEDGAEVNAHNTNPIVVDTDGDGFDDGTEVNELGTDGSKLDTDDDGFRDDVEVALESDPTSADSAPPANTVVLNRIVGNGENWNTPDIWSDGQAPSPDKAYVVVGSLAGVLRTPGSEAPAFEGGSLTLAVGGVLDVRHEGNAAIPNLTIRRHGAIEVRSANAGITGDLTLEGDLTIDHRANESIFSLNTRILGDGEVTQVLDEESVFDAETHLLGAGSDYASQWQINGGVVKAIAAGSLGQGGVVIRSGTLQVDYNVSSPAHDLAFVGGDFTLCLNGQLVFKSMKALSPEDESNVLFQIPGGDIAEGDYDANTLVNDVGFGDEQVKGEGLLVLVGDLLDSDNDGLLDDWENEQFGNLAQTEDGDPDEDGLINRREFEGNGNPNNADSDDDGLTDGAEIDQHGSDPNLADTDGDGLTDSEEVNGATPSDPTLADTDDDGLTDSEEVNGNPATNPALADSDGDGFRDAFEIAQGSNPTEAASVPDDQLGEPTLVFNEIAPLPSFHDIEDGADLLDVSFRTFIDFEAKPEGDRELIFETGGATIGMSLVYEAPSKLVYRADGNGGLSLSLVEHTLTADQLAAGELEVIWIYDVDNGNGEQIISLFVDGTNVGSQTQDIGGDWSGTNAAAFGAASDALAGDGQNNVLTALDFTSGTINTDRGLEMFSDRLFIGTGGPDPEPQPSGFQITEIVRSANGVQITWESEAGAAYEIQYGTTLQTDDWTMIGNMNGAGAETSFEDTDATRTAQALGFYRVRRP